MNKKIDNIFMPALPMRGLVIFPEMILHFDVGREKSVKALKEAIEKDKRIFLTAQKDVAIAEPGFDDVYEIGVIAEIRQILNTPDNTTRVLVQGISKASLVNFTHTDPCIVAEITPIEPINPRVSKEEQTALTRMIVEHFQEYGALSPKMPKELYEGIIGEKDLAKLLDLIIFNVYFKVDDKQALLEATSLKSRAEMLITILINEVSIMELEQQISEEVHEAVEQNQREFYLREQMRIISKQLGEGDNIQEEIFEYMDKIEDCCFTEDIEEKLVKEAEKLFKMSPTSQEAGVIRSYLDAVLDLPWGIYTNDKLDIAKAQKQLDKDHYGLKKVKERILELIAVRAMENSDVKGQIICLVGPPGVGKTSVGKSIATALGRNYARVSLGGVHDEADIRGHRKTYIGAMPGRVANAFKQAKSMNPVILFDEIDKMGNDYKGDPSSAMLEVLDVEQNVAFRDHYLEIPMDLSDALFITTANTLDTIPAPLLDRMEVIELGSYTREEKFHIAKKHLIPKQKKQHGLTSSTFRITDSAIYVIIDNYTREAGVRKLERRIAELCRKAAKQLISMESSKVTVSPTTIEKILGVKKYISEDISKQDEVGVVNGLAWTSVGGVIMPLEVLVLPGTGKIEVTGSLGDVMKESSKIAVSLARSLADKYNFNPNFYKENDLHIHAPEGAVPKDGPSAGVTMTTALVSALSGVAIRRDVAMTGEITLHGKVLPIGGLREKTMAAYKAGIKTVVIPKENEPDLQEIDKVITDNVKFVIAEKIDTVLDTALVQTNVRQGAKANKKIPNDIITATSKKSKENLTIKQ